MADVSKAGLAALASRLALNATPLAAFADVSPEDAQRMLAPLPPNAPAAPPPSDRPPAAPVAAPAPAPAVDPQTLAIQDAALQGKINIDKSIAGGPPPPVAPRPHAAAPAAPVAPKPDGVDAALASEEGPELAAYNAKQAIQGVHDPALDAKAKQAKEEAELNAALTGAQNNRKVAEAQAYFANQFGKPELAKNILEKANQPLADLLQKRELLSKMQDERVKREGEDRQRQLNDENSDVTKTAVAVFKLAHPGFKLPSGFTAANLQQFNEIAKLPEEQREKAIADTLAQNKFREDVREHNLEHSDRQANLAAQREEKAAAAGAGSKAEVAMQEEHAKALEKAKAAATELKTLIDSNGTVPLNGEARGRAQQLRQILAEANVTARAKPGVVPRTNAIEEQLGLIPEVGFTPGAALRTNAQTKNLLDSYVKDIGADAGVAPPPAGKTVVERRGNVVKYSDGTYGRP